MISIFIIFIFIVIFVSSASLHTNKVGSADWIGRCECTAAILWPIEQKKKPPRERYYIKKDRGEYILIHVFRTWILAIQH